MRIILKPLGAVLTIGILVGLSFTAFKYQQKNDKAQTRPDEELVGTMASPTPRVYPKEGIPIFGDDPGQWNLVSPSASMATLEEKVSTSIPVGKRELIFDVRKRPDKADLWLINNQRILPVPVFKGDSVRVEFWGRAIKPGNLTVILAKTGKTELALAEGAKPATDLFQKVELTTEWKHYVVLATIKQNYPAFAASLQFQPDHSSNTFEFVQIIATDFGATGNK